MRQSTYVLLTALSFAACAHHQESSNQPASAAPPPESQPEKKADGAAPPSAANAQCQNDMGCQSGQLCMNSACVLATAELCSKSRVQFPFNSAQLPDAEKPALQRAARCLQANHNMSLTIEGNADERGTEEYNLALGEQRARGIARYMEELGASSTQLRTMSYGKDKPLCTEHDEDCWAQNRRAALKVKQVAND